jgi:glucose-1-phosphate thymidylyltransferase
MINKIIIAAAGRGTRMGDLAEDQPKHLIPILGKPFIYYLLQNIKEAGFTEIYLVVGHLKEQFGEFAKEYQDEFDIHPIDQIEKMGSEKYGSALPVMATETEIAGEDFVYLMGDNLYSVEDLKLAREKEVNTLFVMETNCPAKYSDTKVDEKDNFVEFVVDREAPPAPACGNSGLYVFEASIFDLLHSLEKDPINKEFTITHLFAKIRQKDGLKVVRLVGDWLDFGCPEDVPKLENYIENKG